MSYYVYMLKSDRDRHYLGYSEDLADRIPKHNSKHKGFTGTSETWKLLIQVTVETKSEAIKLERYLKSMKNYRRAIRYMEKLNSSVASPPKSI